MMQVRWGTTTTIWLWWLVKRKRVSSALSLLLIVAIFCLLLTLQIKQQQQSDARINNRQSSVIEARRRGNQTTITANGPLRPFKPKFLLTNQMIDQLNGYGDGDDTAAAAASSEQLREALQVQSSRVLSLKNVTFLEPAPPTRPSSIKCAHKEEGEEGKEVEGTKLLIVVNSKWNNRKRRQRMRSTWLNPANLNKILCDHQLKLSQHNLNNDVVVATTTPPSKQLKAINGIDYVFALGLSGGDIDVDASASSSTTSETSGTPEARKWLREERKRFGDLVVINLYENYRTMSLKHLSIIKWLLRRDAQQQQQQLPSKKVKEKQKQVLVLKCDDDAQIDLDQLLLMAADQISDGLLISGDGGSSSFGNISIQEQHQEPEIGGQEEGEAGEVNNWIMCARFPTNTRVMRSRRNDRQASGSKWLLTRAEYPFDTFPGYCSGLAYLAPLKLLERLFKLAHVLLLDNKSSLASFDEPLWVDDVFVTGILLESMANRPKIIQSNGHFCYERQQVARRQALNLPCMVWEDYYYHYYSPV